MNIFYWVIALLLVGMGGYTGYTNWSTYFKAKKLREQFLKSHPDAEVIKSGQARGWLYILMLVFCAGLGIVLLNSPTSAGFDADTRLAQGVVYIGLGIFAFAMAGEAMMDSVLVATPDSLVYEDQVLKFKNIRGVTVGKGWFKSSYILLNQAKEIPVSKSIAMRVDALLVEWKQNRKATFRNRKERRAAARRERESK